MKKCFSFLLLLPLLFLSLRAQFGFLDSDYDADGKQIVDLGITEQFNKVRVQPDGMIVAAGSADNGTERLFFVMRTFPDGSFDPSFNGMGYLVVDFDVFNSNYNSASDLVILPDGKILVVGTSRLAGDNDFAMVRLKANGSIDSTFGTFGKLTFYLTAGGAEQNAYSVALDADGNYLVGGYTGPLAGPMKFLVLKVTPSAGIASSWGAGGYVTADGSANSEFLQDLIVLQDGRLLGGGISYDPSTGGKDFVLVMMKADGTLDNSFSSDGRVTTHFLGNNDYCNALAQQPDGKIVAAGTAGSLSSGTELAIARYNLTGNLDLTFDTDGKVTTNVDGGGNDEELRDLVIQPDGKLLACGYSVDIGTRALLARYETNGALDPSFGVGGLVLSDLSPTGDHFFGIAMQPDLKVVACGYVNDPLDGVIARYITGLVLSTADAPGQVPFSLFPNPAHEEVTLQYHCDHPTPAEIHLTDLQGRVLHTFSTSITLDAGNHDLELNLPTGLAPGGYLVVLVTGQGNVAAKLVTY